MLIKGVVWSLDLILLVMFETESLTNTLLCTPIEQLFFLDKLCRGDLPIGNNTMRMTKKTLHIGTLEKGWQLYGKTGSRSELTLDESQKLNDRKIGWFIGWIQKGSHAIIFVQYSETEDQQYSHRSQLAKEMAEIRLHQIIKERR